MKISAIFLAAMFVLALSGQAVEARDHHNGWRNGHHGHHRNHNNWNNGSSWNNRRYNNRGWNSNRGWNCNRNWQAQQWNNGWNNNSNRWNGGRKMTPARIHQMQKHMARGNGYRWY